jgi:DNA polymerase-3 subunit delta'
MAVTRPAMSKRKVFIIGAAESLVSQEASPEAANALLKVLEEPPTDTVFVLTSNDPDELLPTIRSRLLPIRVQPLSTDVVAAALREALSVNEAQAKLAARLSEGSIGRALAFLPSNGSPGQLEEVRTQARELLEAAVHPKPTDRLAAALAVGPAGARGVFTDTLDLLALWIRDLAAVASGAAELVVNIDATDRLLVMANQLPAASQGAPIALRSIDLARGMTRSNLNPQLTLAWLLREIGQALRPQF